MSSLAITGIVFACIVVGAVIGMIVRSRIPEHHASSDTKDVIKLGVGLLGTMTALVLGLLVASAKSSYDAQGNGLAQLSGNVIFLDRTLALYGPETKDVREMLRAGVADMLRRTWPEEDAEARQQGEQRSTTEGRYEAIIEKILALTPKNDPQRLLQSQAFKSATDIGQTRWLLFAKSGRSIPTAFLVVLVCWLTLLFGSFSLFSRPNTTVVVTLLLCALAVAASIFLILELDQPFDGIVKLSSDPLRRALAAMGK